MSYGASPVVRRTFLFAAAMFVAVVFLLGFSASAYAADSLVVNPGGSCSDVSPSPRYCTIQAAIDAANPGDTINIFPGVYSETASGRWVRGTNGPHQFGLFIEDNGITLQGVDASGVAIDLASAVLARINTNSTANFGPDGIFVQGDDVTIAGLEIGTNTGGQNKTIEVIGDGFVLKNSYVNDPEGSVYINEWAVVVGTPYIASYVIENNIFGPGVTLDIASGPGRIGLVSGRVVQGNLFKTFAGPSFARISFSGSGTTVPWYTYAVGGAQIVDNTFEVAEIYVRARGTYAETEFDWAAIWNDNNFPKAAVAVDDVATFAVNAFTYACGSYTCPNTRRIGGLVQPEIDVATAGDVVLVKPGAYAEQISISKDLTLQGAGPTTIIQSPATLAAKTINAIARYPVVFAETGSAIVVKNLTVDGNNVGNANNPFIGVAFSNAGGAVQNVEIENVQNLPFDGVQHGVGLYANVADGSQTHSLLVKGVTIHDFQKNGMAFSTNGTSKFNVDVVESVITGRGATNITAQNGIQYNQAGGTLTGKVVGSTINGIAYDNTASSTKWVATSLLNFYASLEMSGNTIGGGAHMGIYSIDAPVVINGNTVNVSHAAAGSTDGYGIIASDPPGVVPSPLVEGPVAGAEGAMVFAASGTILPVDVSRNVVTFVDAPNAFSTVGIEADAGWGDNSIAFSATGNVVTGFDYGFFFGKCAAPSTCYAGVFDSIRARYNSITGSTEYGMFSDTGNPIVDAEYNYWGGAAPTAPNGVSANVDADPYLTTWPSAPVLSVPATPITASSFALPVNYTPGSAQYAAVAFTLAYDASCLAATGVTGLPLGFVNSVDYSVPGRVDIAVWDGTGPMPFGPLSAGVLANVSFNVLSGCANPVAAVEFSSTPTVASCGDLYGAGFECQTAGALLPISVNDAPSDITLTPSMVNEKVSNGTVVGVLGAVDADGPSAAFTFAGGVDDSSFTIDGSNLKTNAALNFEAKSVYAIKVQVSDGANTFSKDLRVYLLDVNEAPTGVDFSPVTLVETVPANTVAGTLSTTGDPDAGAAHTYSIQPGLDAASFQILPGTNDLLTAASLTNGVYCVNIRSTDNDNPLLSVEKQECVTVLDTAELTIPPTAPYNHVVRKGHEITATVQYAANGNTADSLSFDLNYGTQCLEYVSATGLGVVTVPGAGSLHVVVSGSPDIATGAVSTLRFRAKSIGQGCTPAKLYEVPLVFANETLADDSFALAVNGTDGNLTVINNDPRGDCNSDTKVNAGDFTAIILEYFDSDMSDTNWLKTTDIIPFDGSPYGCDANASGASTVPDVTCTVNIVFGNPACSLGGVQAASVTPAVVGVDDRMPVTAGDTLEVPVTLEGAGNRVAAVAFTFQFDPALVAFDPTDADGDGLPDAVQFNVKGNLLRIANYIAEKHELQVAVAGVSVPMPVFGDGPIVTVSLNGTAGGAVSPALKGVSVGSADGADVPVIVKSQGAISGWTRTLLPAVTK